MNLGREARRWTTLCALALTLTGCRSSANTRKAALAEREGRHHEAYDLYCAEARQSPSNRGVRRDIARVGPKAARYWQTEGDRAAGRGQYADAWKLYMRALEITPDNTALVSLVRNLESQHAQAIAPVKDQWMAGADRIIASAEPVDDPPPAGGGATWQSSAPSSTPPSPPPVFASRPAQPPAVSSTPSSVPPKAAPPSAQRPAPPPAPAAAPSAADDALEAESAASASGGEFHFTTILSVGDKRFPKRSQVFDGLRIRLLDTDAELDADFDIALDESKTKKARNIPTGRGVIVRGRSGKWYEVVVLTVVNTTESVRFGVRPYDR